MNNSTQRALFDHYCALFQPNDPYAGFPVDDYPADPQGWGSVHPFFDAAITIAKPKVIVEVGSWKGLSAINMANQQKAHGIDGVVLCVDTWLGSTDHALNPHENGSFPSLRHRFGFPQLFYTFMANVIAAGHTDRIVPVPNTSEAVAVMLDVYGIKADLIYIDGAHEEHMVRRDLDAYWPLLADDGIMLLDDYAAENWAGVTRAIDGFVAEHKPAGAVPALGKYLVSRRSLAVEPWPEVV